MWFPAAAVRPAAAPTAWSAPIQLSKGPLREEPVAYLAAMGTIDTTIKVS